jgi:hypothetical protein
MLRPDRLLPVERACEVFGFDQTDLGQIRTLYIEGKEAVYLADCSKLFLELDGKEQPIAINPQLLDEASAARAVSLTLPRLKRLRSSGAIRPPAYTVVGGPLNSSGRGRRTYLYDIDELKTQLLNQSSGGVDLDAWATAKAGGRA